MSEPKNVLVRRIGPDDWHLLREVRLAALADSPWAFASTLAREQQFSEQVWRKRLAAYLSVLAFGAANGVHEPVGIVGGFEGEQGVELVGMWVAPQSRGSRAADALVEEVCAWAAEQGHLTLALWIVEGNAAAECVYARHGFLRTGRSKPVREGEPAVQHEMIRLLPPVAVPNET